LLRRAERQLEAGAAQVGQGVWFMGVVRLMGVRGGIKLTMG
jgi:hypothetical protein